VERKVSIDHARLNWLRQRNITFPEVEKRLLEHIPLSGEQLAFDVNLMD